MSRHILIEQNVKPGKMDELKAILRRNWSTLLDFPGNQGAQLFDVPGDVDRLVLLMQWADESDFDEYQRWRVETGDAAEVYARLQDVVIRPLTMIDPASTERHPHDNRPRA